MGIFRFRNIFTNIEKNKTREKRDLKENLNFLLKLEFNEASFHWRKSNDYKRNLKTESQPRTDVKIMVGSYELPPPKL